MGLIQKRVKKMVDTRVGIIHFLTEPNLILENFEREISKILLENSNINFVIVDSFDKVMRCNQNKYIILHNLKRLADLKNIGILIINNDDSISCYIDTIWYLNKNIVDLYSLKIIGKDIESITINIWYLNKNIVDLYSLKIIGKDIESITINMKLDENLNFIKDQQKQYLDTNEDETILAISKLINSENKSFKGTSTDLLNELLKIDVNLKSKVNTLTRKLNSYKSLLETKYNISKYNISYENRRVV